MVDYTSIGLFLAAMPFIIRLTRSITELNYTMRQNAKEHRAIRKILDNHEKRLLKVEVTHDTY